MSATQNAGEQRVLISSASLLTQASSDAPSTSACFIDLPDPVDNATATFLFANNTLQECNTYRPRFASWFADNSILSEGALHLATPVDPLFILLPALDAARRGGSFCDIEQILQCLNAPPSTTALLVPLLIGPNAAQLACICDTKDAGGQQYFRLNDDKVLAWLKLKVTAIKTSLAVPATPFADLDDHSLTAYAAGLVGEYVTAELSSRLSKSLDLPSADGTGATKAGAPAGYNPDTVARFNPNANSDGPDAKKQRFDPKEAAKAKAQEARAATKAAKLAKEASGMRKLSAFFTKKASK